MINYKSTHRTVNGVGAMSYPSRLQSAMRKLINGLSSSTFSKAKNNDKNSKVEWKKKQQSIRKAFDIVLLLRTWCQTTKKGGKFL